MGTGCSHFHSMPYPNPANNPNTCTVYNQIGYDPANPSLNISSLGIIQPTDFCLPIGTHKTHKTRVNTTSLKNKASQYCHNITGDEVDGTYEWEFDQWQGECEYNDAHPSSGQLLWDSHKPVIKERCCRGECMIDGWKMQCKRNAFHADPVVCCFLDNDCAGENNITDNCWQTKERKRTCDPTYRNLKSTACLDKIEPYCTGEKLFAGQSHWTELWIPDSVVDVNSGDAGSATIIQGDGINQRLMKQPCLRAVARAIYNDSGSVCTWDDVQKLDLFQGVIDSDGLVWAKKVLAAILNKYTEEYGSPIGSINQDGYIQSSNFINFYWDLCKTFPILCTESLTNFCSKTTEEDLLSQPESVKWCGCYMPQNQYEKYEKYSVNRECTPFCNIKGNITLVEDGVNKVCTQNICILNDSIIKLNQVINPDGVNFNQICNSCGGVSINKVFQGSNTTSRIIDPGRGDILIINDKNGFSQILTPSQQNSDYWYTQLSAADVAKDNLNNAYILVYLDVPSLTPQDTFQIISLDIKNVKVRDGSNYYADGISSLLGKIKTLNEDKVIIDLYQSTVNGLSIKIYGHFKKSDIDAFKNGTLVFSELIFKAVTTTVDGGKYSDGGKYTANGLYNLSSNDGSGTQVINNNIREDNIQIASNTCRCITDGTNIDIIDSRVKSANIQQNCGGTQCFNKKGDTIDCNSVNDSIISSVTNSFKTFEKELVTDKRAIILEALIVLLIILFFLWLSIQYRPKTKK